MKREIKKFMLHYTSEVIIPKHMFPVKPKQKREVRLALLTECTVLHIEQKNLADTIFHIIPI